MTEIWLRNNARALAFGLVLPALLVVFGLALLITVGADAERWWVGVLGGLMAVVGLLVVTQLVIQLRQPRLAYRDGVLLVCMKPGSPIRVPIEIVEGFLLGQGPSMLPGRQYQTTETSTVVIRLAESAQDWADVPGIKPALGKWCGGYITIRGTWCEPLSVDLVNRLNRRLAEVQSQHSPTKATP